MSEGVSERAVVVQPDAPDGRPWLVLERPDLPEMPGGPLWLTASSHVRLCDALHALFRPAPPLPPGRCR